jgi:hypothetical protein
MIVSFYGVFVFSFHVSIFFEVNVNVSLWTVSTRYHVICSENVLNLHARARLPPQLIF